VRPPLQRLPTDGEDADREAETSRETGRTASEHGSQNAARKHSNFSTTELQNGQLLLLLLLYDITAS